MRFGTAQQHDSPADKERQPQLRTGQTFLERMGVLYADRIRLNIVAELYMREMSPKQFFEQVGGSSYPSVWRHFMKLVDYGWLRRVRTADASGRGRPEVLYRSTELAVIDDETWEQIPASIRDSFTVQNIWEMGERLQSSLVAGTFNLESRDDLLSYVTLLLDEAGWAKAIDTLNKCFRSLSLEQTDAKLRLEKSGDVPSLMMVELGGFELPHPVSGTAHPKSLPMGSLGQRPPNWPRRISKIFSDPLNLEIISRLNDDQMSPTQLHNVLGVLSIKGFDARCKMLMRLGWVAKVDEQTGGGRRGATEHFYRATSPALSSADLFENVPKVVESSDAWGIFKQFCSSALNSVRTDTFNRRPDRHLTLCKLLVDEIGREQIIRSLLSCVKSINQIEAEAKHRMKVQATTTELGVGCLVAGFVCPLNERRSAL